MIGDNDTVHRLVEKWAKRIVLPKGGRGDYLSACTAILLENQNRTFETTHDSCNEVVLGTGWRDRVLDAIGEIVPACASHELFAWQPLTAPIGQIAYYDVAYEHSPADSLARLADEEDKSRAVERNIPEIRLDIRTYTLDTNAEVDEVVARSRRITLTQPQSDVPNGIDLTKCVVEEVFARSEREAIASLLDAAESNQGTAVLPPIDLFQPLSQLRESVPIALSKPSTMIHKLSMRGPANRLVCGPKFYGLLKRFYGSWKPIESPGLKSGLQVVGAFMDKWLVLMDPVFPDEKLLFVYQGSTILDTSLVFAPYVISYSPPIYSTLLTQGLTVTARGSHKVVNPRLVAVCKLVW